MEISIIIPTYNEEANILPLLHFLEEEISGKSAEIIVIDGGSTDATRTRVMETSARFMLSENKGRAFQMNEAAEAAKGDLLYFVHADTRPPVGFYEHLLNAVNNRIKAGCFTSIFDWAHPFLRFCNWFSRLPFWFCRGGGQTLFVNKRLFKHLEGFDTSMMIMEEYDFIERVKEVDRFKVIKENAISSARDYRANGAVRLQMIYAYVFFLYSIGASQEKMVKTIKKHVVKPSKSCID